VGLPIRASGTPVAMTLPLILIVIGIVLALLVSWILGIIVIVIGLAMLIFPRVSAGRTRRV
jgi:uncharacterized membrane protein